MIVCINGLQIVSFLIKMGARQGCPLAPFLLLLVGQTLNSISKQKMREGLLYRNKAT